MQVQVLADIAGSGGYCTRHIKPHSVLNDFSLVTEIKEVVPISTMYDYQRNVNVEYRSTFQGN